MKHRTTRNTLTIPEYLAWRWGWFTGVCGFLLGMFVAGLIMEAIVL